MANKSDVNASIVGALDKLGKFLECCCLVVEDIRAERQMGQQAKSGVDGKEKKNEE